MNEYLVLNPRLLDPLKGRTEAAQMVLVRGDCFASVGWNLRASRNVRKIELGGRGLVPGLIDSHNHIMSIKTKCANKTFMHKPASLPYAETAAQLRKLLDRDLATVCDAGGADMGHR